MTLIMLLIPYIALLQIVSFTNRLRSAVSNVPHLKPITTSTREAILEQLAQPSTLGSTSQSKNQFEQRFPKVSVIIPAYNEEVNVQDCATSVLNSTKLPSENLEVWIVDDQSTDNTLSLAKDLQLELKDPRLKVLAGKPRPANQTWIGKNWACAQCAEQATGDFLLFIDADVRLKPRAIETIVQAAEEEQIDLLTCMPVILCKCFAEWLAQPLIINILFFSFDFAAVNDPKTKIAFGIGPFMFFRRSAYEQIGGHRAVGSQVLEDSELARRIKQSGLKLKAVSAPELSAARMYRSLTGLWEGWTKNMYLLAERNFWRILSLAFTMLFGYTVPWLALIVIPSKLLIASPTLFDLVALCLIIVAIYFQHESYKLGKQAYDGSTRYWWLSSIGGAFVAMIALTSVIKTKTGWGWTWRGRLLSESTS